MRTLTLLQSAPLVGPLGWLFGGIAVIAITLLVRLWYSMGNKERVAMEREIKASSELLVKFRTERLEMGQRNSELIQEKLELQDIIKSQNKRIAEVQQANELLRETENKQGMLISALTERCARNERLIIKLYTDLGKTIDLKNVGGEQPDAPGTSE